MRSTLLRNSKKDHLERVSRAAVELTTKVSLTKNIIQ